MSAETEQQVRAYVNLRSVIRAKKEAFESEIKQLESQLDSISNLLMDTCNAMGMDSFKTPEGTVTRSVRTRYWAQDWDAMSGFILEHEAPYLLEKRLHSGNLKTFMEENPEVDVPGLMTDHKYVITVRQAKRG